MTLTSGNRKECRMTQKRTHEPHEREVETRIKDAELIEIRRKQIIEGALRVFTKKGFHDATVREIADEAGLTMGSLYNYIRTKEDIIFVVYDYVTKFLREEMRKAIQGITDPEERLKAALQQNLNAVNQHQDTIMFLYKASALLSKESLYVVLERETEYIELFEDLLKEYFKGQDIDKDRLRIAADLLPYIPVIVSLRRWSLKRRFDSIDAVMEGILEFILRGIGFISEKPEATTS